MNTCPDVPRLNAFLDGELPRGLAQEVEAHLAGCPACRAELRQLERLSSLVRTAQSPALTPAGRQNLYGLAAVAEETSYLRIAEWTTALAASVLLAAGGWMLAGDRASASGIDTTQNWRQVVLNPSNATETPAEPGFAEWVVTDLSERQP